MTTVEPFRIAVPDDVLTDLRRRLANTRWPEAECVADDARLDWRQGIPLSYTRELAEFWRTDYDWRAREALNRFSQFTTDIDGVVNSPVAQLAWIVEKFWSWTDCDGHPEDALTRDEMLDDVTLYWVTATGASSARLYWERMAASGPQTRVDIPTGVASFPKEISRPPRSWCERPTTSPTGRRCRAVVTSRRSNSGNCWSTTSGRSSPP